MTEGFPSPQKVLEILSRDLSFESLWKEFPSLTGNKLRQILLHAAKLCPSEFIPQNAPSVAAPEQGAWIAYIDGASRGNPGPASAAANVYTSRGVLQLKRFIGINTNNVAEYEALLMVLEAALENGVESIEVRSDSELLVKQNKGEYRAKNHNLAKRLIRAKNLEKMFKSFTISHVPREENKEADRLANEALDEMLKEAVTAEGATE
jgi:ribonuclease HI